MSNADPIRQLQAAARAAGQLVAPGSQVARVCIFGVDGRRIADFTVPIGAVAVKEPPHAQAEEPSRPGWSFSGNSARFDGAPIAIHGRKLDVLRVLAEADGPLGFEDLRAAWGNYKAEESTIRWTLAELRKDLKRTFIDLEGDPIENTPAGYTLVIR